MQLGFLWAVAAAVLSGSWSAIVKAPRLRALELHPAVLNVYFMAGFFLASLAIASLGGRLAFTPWGLLSGLLLVGASAGTLSLTIPTLGIAVATCVSNSTVIATGFAWSAVALRQPERSAARALAGLVVVVAGLQGVVYSSVMQVRRLKESRSLQQCAVLRRVSAAPYHSRME
jgi:hypothetical protein